MPRYKFTTETTQAREILYAAGIETHVRRNDGTYIGICAATCLAYFGVLPGMYRSTSTKSNRTAFNPVLRKHGWEVVKQNIKYGVQRWYKKGNGARVKMNNWPTLSEVKRAIKNDSEVGKDDRFLLVVDQRRSAHAIVIDGNGKTLVDTAPGKRWRVSKVYSVKK